MTFGWSYYMGWIAMAASVGLALFTIFNECLESVKQPVFPNVFNDNPAYYIAQQNSEAREKIKDVHSDQILHITNSYQVNPVSVELTKK